MNLDENVPPVFMFDGEVGRPKGRNYGDGVLLLHIMEYYYSTTLRKGEKPFYGRTDPHTRTLWLSLVIFHGVTHYNHTIRSNSWSSWSTKSADNLELSAER